MLARFGISRLVGWRPPIALIFRAIGWRMLAFPEGSVLFGVRFPMVFERIEQLKRQYTDKYVIVDASRPELARFKGQTGRVRTVNMNGQALVEFDAYANIGWYDIGLDYLKVIDQPLPKEEKKERAPAAKEAPAKPAAAKPAAEKAAPGKKSTSDVLAAARAGKAAAEGSTAPAASGAVAKAAPAAGEKKKLSVAEMMAAARAEKQPGGALPQPRRKRKRPPRRQLPQHRPRIARACRRPTSSPPPRAASRRLPRAPHPPRRASRRPKRLRR